MHELYPSRPEFNEQPLPLVTPDSFPMPDRANTFPYGQPQTEAEQEKLAKTQAFAELEAAEANRVLGELRSPEFPGTADAWRGVYGEVTNWRFNLAVASSGHQFVEGAQGIPAEAQRVLMPITDDATNRDRIGTNGRLRFRPEWDDTQQTFVGGQPTPASEISDTVGRIAEERFAAEGNATDTLQTAVTLPDGRVVNGNKLVRGETAKAIPQALKQGVAARGHDVSRFDLGGDGIMFSETGTEADRAAIFEAAMDALASEQPGQMSIDSWANTAYLLYQAPQYKRGTDAVIRTFLVAAGTRLLGEAPVVPQDVDLRAYTMGQEAFVEYVKSAQHS
jgi:hypothetical protein